MREFLQVNSPLPVGADIPATTKAIVRDNPATVIEDSQLRIRKLLHEIATLTDKPGEDWVAAATLLHVEHRLELIKRNL